MAKGKATKTKTRKKPVDEDVEEIDGVDELEEVLDEDEDEETTEEETDEDSDDEDEDEEDEDDDEEEEVTQKKSKSKKKGKKKGSRAAKDGKVGTTELADHFGVDARTLRVVLRKHNIAKDAESGRYEWDSLEDKTVKKIGKLLKEGAAETAKKEQFDKLKEKGEKKKKDKAASKEGKKKGKKKKAPVEDDDDEE